MIEEKNRAWKEGEKHKGHKTQHKKRVLYILIVKHKSLIHKQIHTHTTWDIYRLHELK